MKRIALVACVVGALVPVLGAPAHGASEPSVRVDPGTAEVGETVVVYLKDFESSSVNLAICGNLARRGSADCNMQASQNQGVDYYRPMSFTVLRVAAPPVPCPCVVRVANQRQSELAVAPLELVGHPIAPVVDAPHGPLIDVSVSAARVDGGLTGALRSWLGGRATYRVAVSVHNRTKDTLPNISLSGAARRGIDEVASFDLPRPGPLAPGATWRHTVSTDVSAPVIGRYTWVVAASGAGSTVEANDRTDIRPFGLFAVLAFITVDVLLLVWRLLFRRRRRRQRAIVAGPHPALA